VIQNRQLSMCSSQPIFSLGTENLSLTSTTSKFISNIYIVTQNIQILVTGFGTLYNYYYIRNGTAQFL